MSPEEELEVLERKKRKLDNTINVLSTEQYPQFKRAYKEREAIIDRLEVLYEKVSSNKK